MILPPNNPHWQASYLGIVACYLEGIFNNLIPIPVGNQENN